MDTLTTTIKRDTVFLTKDTLRNPVSERHITTETTTHKRDSDCFLNLCDCKLLSDLIWPLTVLIILFSFKKQFQKIIDSIGDRIKKGAKFKFGKDGIELGQELSESELNEKAEKEYKEIIKESATEQTEKTSPITKTEFVPNYLHVERQIFEVLLKSLYPRYKILSNRRIGRYEYDLIIDTLDNKDFDYVIEVKYYPNGISKMGLQDISLKLNFMTNDYKDSTNKLGKPALIIVTNQGINTEMLTDTYKHLNEPFKDKNYIKLLMIKQSDIEKLTRSKIIEFLED